MKKKFALLLAMLMCFGLFAGCNSNGSSDEASNTSSAGSDTSADTSKDTTESSDPVTVTIGATYSRFVGVFDMSQLANDQLALPAGYLAFDTLLRMEVMDDGTSDYYSDILEDYYVDDAQENMVFVLKPGVYFSNGEEMDGYDIIYSMLRKGCHTRMASDYAMFDFADATVDGYTVTIPLNSYRGDWEVKLEAVVVMNYDWIIEHGGAEDPSDLSNETFDWTDPSLVCGSGPYSVTEYVADDHVTYVKRDDWWQADTAGDDVAQPDTIITKAYADASTMMVDYQNGVLDAVLGLSETQYEQASSDSSLGTAVATSSKSVVWLVMDVDNTPELQDVELRKAIAMGTKIDDLGVVAYGSLALEPEGMFSMSTPFGSEGYTFDYDPDTAAQIVKDLGYEGLTLPMICDSDVSGMAEVWQEQMRLIGINIDLQIYDVMTCIQYWVTPGATAFQFLGNDNANVPGDPSTSMSNMWSGTDLAALRKTGEEWNDLVTRGMNGTTTEERKAVYDEMQQFNLDNAYCIPIVEWESAYVYGASGVVKDMIVVMPESCNLRRVIVK
jgi:peptide/nickel transport system substrate-binding protein